VEKLAVDSAENLAGRTKAEAALESTGEELQRAARFSADASHQLITPVAVMRAGLEELLAHDHLSAAERESLSALIHQTYRLSGIIKDLLLLSRLDAGRLRLELTPVDLVALIASAVDDLSALPDASELAVETDVPATLPISAERGYAALILQNLLENAREAQEANGSSAPIRVRLVANQNVAEVRVRDEGCGLPENPDRVGDPFFTTKGTGTGLGVYVARAVADGAGGGLRYREERGSWTEAIWWFPMVHNPGPPGGDGEHEEAPAQDEVAGRG
jgi:signal transduction histidine kinase